MNSELSGKILIVDDNPAIHEDYRKVLHNLGHRRRLPEAAARFLGQTQAPPASINEQDKATCKLPESFELQGASQGREAIELVQQLGPGHFDLAFVDMRMPPGIDGIDTILGIWKIDPSLPCVICTAYSDYSWRDIRDRLPRPDQFLILKKPFEAIEVRQMATAMAAKRSLELTLRSGQPMTVSATGNEAELGPAAETNGAATAKQNLAQHPVAGENPAASAGQSNPVSSWIPGALVANVGHQLRTPLTSILGYAETFLDDQQSENLEPQQRQAVDTIRRSGDQLLALVDNLLDLSRIAAGQLELDMRACEPLSLLQEVIVGAREEAVQREVQLELSLSEDFRKQASSKLVTDPQRFKQVVAKLLEYALHQSQSGDLTLLADCDSSWLNFSIRGNVQFTSDPEHDMRLAYASSMIAALGGRLHLVQNPQLADPTAAAGHLGWQLPWQHPSQPKAKLPADLSSPTSVAVGADTRQRGCQAESLKVLIVDDELVHQHFIRVMLEQELFQVSTAGNGQLAVQKVVDSMERESPFDVVLMDMQMPVMNGFVATRELRKAGYRGVVIALTADNFEDDAAESYAAGCDNFCHKPVKKNELLALLQTCQA